MIIPSGFVVVLAQSDLLLHGLLLTLLLSTGAMVLGTLLALGLALARQLRPRSGGTLVDLYVAVIRNTPLLVQLFLIYFGLPLLGIRLSAEAASLLALSVNLAAYAVEIIRAGIESVGAGQTEAGFALAMSRGRILRTIVLPQALSNVWPALSTQYVHTLLGSSLCSFISVIELSGAAALIDNMTFRSMETYILVSGIYLASSWTLRVLLTQAGARLFNAHRIAGA